MSAVEENLVRSLGAQLGVSPPESPESSEETVPTFDFEDPGFETHIAALTLRDATFVAMTDGLVQPTLFNNAAEAILVDIALTHYRQYRQLPDRLIARLFKERLDRGQIRPDLELLVKQSLARLLKHPLNNREYVADKIAEFARHRAVEAAILKSAELQASTYPDRFNRIEALVRQALMVGKHDGEPEIDYFNDIERRTEHRQDLSSGKLKPNGITTGIPALNNLLLHKGWGRGELTVLMAKAKGGKSVGLGEFCRHAALHGYNALYVSLEVAGSIIADRIDAALSETRMEDLTSQAADVEARIVPMRGRAGKFKIVRRPAGTFTPNDFRRLIESYKSQGITFDLIAVDYLDIMAPNYRTENAIENSKLVWVDMRQIGVDENIALLSATQTNREGAKASVAEGINVAEDYNKIRIADLVLSINATDEERALGEMRLHWAASRNQRGGITLKVKQNLDAMIFISGVVGPV